MIITGVDWFSKSPSWGTITLMAEGENNKKAEEAGNTAQPGTVITPGSVAPDKPTGTFAFDQDGPVQPGSVVAPAAEPAVQPEQAPEPAPINVSSEPLPEGTITWTASEFVAHDKSAGWYMSLALIAALVSGAAYLVSRDLISAGVVIGAALLLAVYGSHKPRQLEYRLGPRGITVGAKAYGYDEFRSFAVVPEGAFSSIVFMPLKRFSPPLSIYYAPEDEERIVAMLSDRLPFEEHRDAIDSLMRRIRF